MDHSPTSSYHPQSNAQAETYNKTMIWYLTCMLDNNTTLDWEEMLPAMMMAYNCHVHRSTKESPFFLKYLHNLRLPYFNLDKPQPLYGQTYVDEAFKNLQVSYQYAKDNMNLAEDTRTEYTNRSVEKRSFKLGDTVLVKFPMVPKGVNHKFFKKWQGNFTIVKKIGNLTWLVRASPHSKPILVHVDRVKHMHVSNKLLKFNPDAGKDYPFQKDNDDFDEPTEGPVKHYSADVHFVDFESASSSEDESEQNEDNADPANVPLPPSPAPASLPDAPERRVTRGAARDLGVFVPDIQLPDKCWSSSTY